MMVADFQEAEKEMLIRKHGYKSSKVMNKNARIYVAGHRGLVGSSITRKLEQDGYSNLVLRRSSDLDLCDQSSVNQFFASAKPDYVFLAAAKVGGILANDSFPADFLRENLQIQTNVIDAAWRHGVQKLLFLGSSCIYPRLAPQPLKEEYLLTGSLEPYQRMVCDSQDCRNQNVPGLSSPIRIQCDQFDATNLYGPNDNFDLEYSHVLPALVRKFHLAKLAAANDIDGLVRDEQRYGNVRMICSIPWGLHETSRVSNAMLTNQKSCFGVVVLPNVNFCMWMTWRLLVCFFMNNYDGEGLSERGCR